jgi:hypothetical protein
MPVRVRADLKALLKVTEDVKKRFRKEVTNGAIGYEMVRTIQDLIDKGISPVDGEGRFEKYSDSYRNAIKAGRVEGKKTVSPVDMYVTGDMMGSLQSVERNGRVFVEFTDEKASYHQEGNSKLPQRKLLPEEGESFTKRITQLILKALRKATRNK